MKKVTYKKGDELHLTVIEGKSGEPIASKEGLICLFDKYARINPGIGQIWRCRVKRVNEKSLIVTPVEMVLTANGCNTLDQFKKMEKPTKFQKVRPNFAYLSKNQIKGENNNGSIKNNETAIISANQI